MDLTQTIQVLGSIFAIIMFIPFAYNYILKISHHLKYGKSDVSYQEEEPENRIAQNEETDDDGGIGLDKIAYIFSWLAAIVVFLSASGFIGPDNFSGGVLIGIGVMSCVLFIVKSNNLILNYTSSIVAMCGSLTFSYFIESSHSIIPALALLIIAASSLLYARNNSNMMTKKS